MFIEEEASIEYLTPWAGGTVLNCCVEYLVELSVSVHVLCAVLL